MGGGTGLRRQGLRLLGSGDKAAQARFCRDLDLAEASVAWLRRAVDLTGVIGRKALQARLQQAKWQGERRCGRVQNSGIAEARH